MNFIAKSAWSLPNIDDKLNRHADNIEIQLLNTDINTVLIDNYEIPQEFIEKPIKCIHTPLNSAGGYDYEIDTPAGELAFIRTVEFADKIAKLKNEQILVICHLSYSIIELKRLQIFEHILQLLGRLARQYRNVDICVENIVVRLTGIYDNVEIVKLVNEPNVYTVLDVCHALMDEHITGLLTNYGTKKNGHYIYETLENAFIKNYETCKLLHLNNTKDLGDGYGEGGGHSFKFTELDTELLKIIYNYYKRYTPNALITLEIKEEDYLNSENFSETLNICKKIFI